VVERYLASRNISVMALKEAVKKEIAQKHKEREVRVLKKMESELSVGGSPGGPKKMMMRKMLFLRLQYMKKMPYIF